MKKYLILAVLFAFSSLAYAERYTFSSNRVDEIDVVINAGTLNVKSADVKNITVEITPGGGSHAKRSVALKEKELNIYLVGEDITDKTVVNLTIPFTADLDINSKTAKVNVTGMSGSLDIDIADGEVNVKKFDGRFNVDTIYAKVNASGTFKELDIETSEADVNIEILKVPAFYEYSVEGSGNVRFTLGEKAQGKKLNIRSTEFYGNLEIN